MTKTKAIKAVKVSAATVVTMLALFILAVVLFGNDVTPLPNEITPELAEISGGDVVAR